MYQICVQGRLTERLAAALEGMTLHGGAVNTVFTGESKTSHNFTDSSTGCAISASSSLACSRRPRPETRGPD